MSNWAYKHMIDIDAVIDELGSPTALKAFMQDAYDWCQANCTSSFKLSTSSIPIEGKAAIHYYYFYFEDKDDAVLFKLTWG